MHIKRWWGIRHIRHAYWYWRIDNHVYRCYMAGLGFVMSESDAKFLDDVWHGRR